MNHETVIHTIHTTNPTPTQIECFRDGTLFQITGEVRTLALPDGVYKITNIQDGKSRGQNAVNLSTGEIYYRLSVRGGFRSSDSFEFLGMIQNGAETRITQEQVEALIDKKLDITKRTIHKLVETVKEITATLSVLAKRSKPIVELERKVAEVNNLPWSEVQLEKDNLNIPDIFKKFEEIERYSNSVPSVFAGSKSAEENYREALANFLAAQKAYLEEVDKQSGVKYDG